MSKTIKTRIQNKHDIPANWEKAINFIPLAGELIIYDDHYFDEAGNKVVVADCVKYKFGDGVTPINDLPFVADLEDRLAELEADMSDLAPVAKSGRFEDLVLDWETVLIFDGGDTDIQLAVLDDTILQ